MTPLSWIKLAYFLVQLANRIAARVDQATWKASGYQEAMADQASALRRSVGIAVAVKKETADMSPEEILRDLEGNHELRD